MKQGYESWLIQIVDSGGGVLKTFDFVNRGKGPVGVEGIAENPSNAVTADMFVERAKVGDSISPNILFATDYGTSDADISLGSTSFGTDSLTGLQEMLDEALTRPILIYWDGKFSVSGALEVHSNTTIIAL